MAKVTDIQDKNGVSKEIQDKDLANRTSQSTVASTDYILLEDTNGAYHKIAKASFTEAVRGALGSVINSVAKGTDIAKVPVLDSNNDLGMGTLANLASVLGGVIRTKTNTYTDLNDVPTDRLICGSVATATYTANIPVQVVGMFISFPGDNSGNLSSQLYITYESTFRLYVRYRWNTWSDWKQITLT